MNAQQQQKAIEALNKQREREQKQRLAMMYHLRAYMKLHYEGIMLPYKVLYDLEKAEHEKTFTEVPPNPFYPSPAVTLATEYSEPIYMGNTRDLPLNDSGLPNLKADAEYQRQWEEYERRKESEKMPLDKWAFWFARFLLPYDLSSFGDFDWWGELPKTEEERQVIDSLKAACMEVQADYKENPQDYNTEPIPRLEKHKTIYDVPYGYI